MSEAWGHLGWRQDGFCYCRDRSNAARTVDSAACLPFPPWAAAADVAASAAAAAPRVVAHDARVRQRVV